MSATPKRIAVNITAGYVPGVGAVVEGVTLAATRLGWEVYAIRDGFEGLLFPERYPEGGLVKLTPTLVASLAAAPGWILGSVGQSDPFHVRTLNANGEAEERDRSDDVLRALREHHVDAVISVAAPQSMSILWKLSRKGLKTVCVPTSVENDVMATALSFGFNSALSFVADMLTRCRQAAQTTHRIGVVEVFGEHAGWLALQSGMAAGADAILIPEIPYDLREVAAGLREKEKAGQRFGLVVAASGATAAATLPVPSHANPEPRFPQMKAALSPGAYTEESTYVIHSTGVVADRVALELQKLTDRETYPLVLGPLAKGGTPTVVDRQLGLGYGVGAVHAVRESQGGVMVVFQPPDLKTVPMAEALNKVRTLPPDSELVQVARALGISFGEAAPQ